MGDFQRDGDYRLRKPLKTSLRRDVRDRGTLRDVLITRYTRLLRASRRVASRRIALHRRARIAPAALERISYLKFKTSLFSSRIHCRAIIDAEIDPPRPLAGSLTWNKIDGEKELYLL